MFGASLPCVWHATQFFGGVVGCCIHGHDVVWIGLLSMHVSLLALFQVCSALRFWTLHTTLVQCVQRVRWCICMVYVVVSIEGMLGLHVHLKHILLEARHAVYSTLVHVLDS